MKRLRVKDASGDREVLLVGKVTVGRDPSCTISAADSLMSRLHAEFSCATDGGAASIRDLTSLNGIRVNDVLTRQALLVSGDVVQVANLRIQYLDDDHSVPAPPSATKSSAEPTAHQMPGQPPEEEERTILLPRPNPASADVAVDRAHKNEKSALQPAEKRAASGQPPRRAAAKGRWSRRLRLSFLTVAILVYVATVIPGLLTRNSLLRATAESRAGALAQWLAAEASGALDVTGVAGASGERVRSEPGVVAARVLSIQGSVLSPSSEANKVVESIPSLNVSPEAVRTLRTAWNGDLVEVACPVTTREGRVAVAWLTFRSSDAPSGLPSSAVLLVVPFMLAVVCALLFSSAVQRQVVTGLQRFNQDIEMATRGDLPEVVDPLGIESMREVAGAVNYLVDRFKSAGLVMQAKPAKPFARGAVAANLGSAPAPSAERKGRDVSVAVPAREAWVLASDQLRIVEVGPGLNGIVKDPAGAIGLHLLDVIKDTALAEAMLDCLAKVQPGGTERAPAAGADSSISSVVVEKLADKRVKVSFLAAEG